MAAQMLLLMMLFSNIHAEFLTRAGRAHNFLLDNAADFCSVSRWTGEGKELLWNSSGSDYRLSRLAVSHSGQYQEQCWTRGNVTLERNSTLLVCDNRMMGRQSLNVNVGETLELICEGVGPNQSAQWAYWKSETEGLALIDDGTHSVYKHRLVENKPSLLITVDKRFAPVGYYCLEKQQHRCVLHSGFTVQVPPAVMLRSVGESQELNCPDDSRNQSRMWVMFNSLRSERESRNFTPMFPSLTLAHSGVYMCLYGVSDLEHYQLSVCPEPEPPAVKLFTGGENLTLHCRDWNQTDEVDWFMRSNRTGGRLIDVRYQRPDNVYLYDSSLVVRNASLQDSGQFWCVVGRHLQCVVRSDFQVMFGEPEVDRHLPRSALLTVVMLMMLAVVVGVIVWRSRRSEQLPQPVEEVEMSQLSPESDAPV